ncbi:NAD(P)-dependent oxidoreductase [Chroococcidiopsis sp. CCALA 051]|uniref:NAD(P)-dependent oxidoreductase n=1 Tax=Chroococcidiopsis sp. CCALA 051 TaxID=869949 RepID=UPI000D0CD60C|nr:NAD(P)-dependent oxidoreductase [Chroococcidiopsis sp. CCALA 051]PSM47544.1 NAD(P)-dependent oxidoreductase [Chroococcidiopsis sp. CCALA 051]
MSRIAVLGIGAMGSRVAQNLLKANHQVIVYNRTAEKAMPLVNQGAVYAATPREAAAQADIVISMVADNEVSRSVWLDSTIGAVLGLRKDAIAIESSTLTVDWTTELAKEIASRGVAFLDAPVVGSRPQADAGKLIYLVGGEAETLAKVQDILLSAGASAVHHVGSNGQGMAMKLAVNALFGIQVAALAEIVGMLTKNGITSAKAIECLGELPVISPAAKVAGNLMLAQNHAPLFPIELVEKDFRYVIQTAQAVEALIPTSAAVRDVYQTAIANGYGSDNITGVAQLFI